MFGFYRLAAAVPRVYLADPASNAAEIIKQAYLLFFKSSGILFHKLLIKLPASMLFSSNIFAF